MRWSKPLSFLRICKLGACYILAIHEEHDFAFLSLSNWSEMTEATRTIWKPSSIMRVESLGKTSSDLLFLTLVSSVKEQVLCGCKN